MKTLTAALFILGIPWLFPVVAAVVSPIGIFMPEYGYQAYDVIFSVLASACGVVGIAVWLGYRLRWKLDSFVWLTKRQFWSLSLIHHTAWVFIIPLAYPPGLDRSYRDVVMDFWLASGLNVYGIWIALSALISMFALLFDHENSPRRHQ